MKIRFLTFLTCISLAGVQTYAADSLDTPHLRILSTTHIDTVNAKLEHSNLLDKSEHLKLLNERGIQLFIVGEHEKAINHFTYVINVCLESTFDEDVFGIALWGRALGYAYLGMEKELIDDLNAIAELIGLYEDCNCRNAWETSEFVYENHNSEQFKTKFLESRTNQERNTITFYRIVNRDNDDSYEFCKSSVINTVNFMKNFVDNFPTYGAKKLIFTFIDDLGLKALECCRGKGFWRNCVNPMVERMNLWKQLGAIPANLQ